MGQSLSLIVAPGLRPMHEQGIARYRARRRGPIVDSGRPVEVSAVHADGHEFPVELTLGRVEQSDRFLVAIVRDTSDRAAVRTARDLERQRTQFFAMASHEIKTPITALSGNLQLAQRHLRRGDTARAAASLDGAMRHLTQMVRLVDDLLEVSRLDAAKFVIQPARLDLGALVAESIERFDTDDGPTAVALRRPQEPVWVDADAVRLGQVIYNLLHNARKYSAARPVEVHVSHEADDAVIRVTDSGIGIPADERPSLFEPFFRTSNTAQLPGTGLGLHLSRRIVELHGGQLDLESSSPDGSTFIVRLPLP
ncbi:MAG TPA: PAS domain-containing sensor histidine kinase [Candidatus Limnocylindria bacterium]